MSRGFLLLCWSKKSLVWCMLQPTWATSRFIVSLSSPGAKKSLVWCMLVLGYISFYCMAFLPWSQAVSGLVHVALVLAGILQRRTLIWYQVQQASKWWKFEYWLQSPLRWFLNALKSFYKSKTMFQCFQVDKWRICHSFGTYKFNVASPYLKQWWTQLQACREAAIVSNTLLPKEDRWPLAMSRAFHISFSPVDPVDCWQYNKSYYCLYFVAVQRFLTADTHPCNCSQLLLVL